MYKILLVLVLVLDSGNKFEDEDEDENEEDCLLPVEYKNQTRRGENEGLACET